ncbi:hypothetical protein DICPUDRAFT_151237 [Dictyostelium purpureum]|uniref:Uncharacterized protein n=1 Tax=Dictyostelium purpureum TaxID=5786 RepID=F0ZIC1_DICPU|nr:uncharacterized protein DICPUDRAFT_151237 [Dictyostelium purpureum]EGC36298.1 hypothetical protein DICPUDRAFT_151237 [Dictyostelium purpureum]|eukprot:XP_003287176.1 hypothetical protein DICPUDRAFT_151237 [Dictyostelium purpureum]
MNKEEIGKFLIGKGYYLTALEFYQELMEDDGTELQSLRNYFNKEITESNTSDPVRSVREKKKNEGGNNNLSAYEMESLKSKDDKIALLEYELRKCKEDLYKTKSHLNTIKGSTTATSHQTPPPQSINVSSPHSINGANGNTSPLAASSSNVFLSLSEEDKDTLKELSKERIKAHELKILNYLVKGYLKKNNYTLTAVSMSEEIEDDINHWSDISKNSAEPPSILTMYRYFFENGDSGIQGALSKSMTEIAKLKKDILETETSFRESKQKIQLLQKENNELLNKNKEFEKKIEEFSRRGLLSPLRSSSAGTSQNDLSGSIPSPKFGDLSNTTITNTNSTSSTPNKLFDTSGLSIMRKTYRNLVEKRRQTVAFRIVSNMDDESEISVRIAEEVDKIRTLDSDNQSIVKIVADSLPNIVPGVLINKREELIPLILIVISNHPDETTRFSLTKLLFNLIKKPNEVQRHVIMRGCMALASFIGPQRTETEILSQCWEQLSEKHPERRVLVADSCGCLSQFASADLRLSLILSILQQLGEDKSSLVRESVAKNFALLINFFDTNDKYNQIEESFKKLLYDQEIEVSIATRLHFLPSLANWTDLLESLHSKLVAFILNEMQTILNKYYSQKDEYKIPEQDTVKLDHLLNCFMDLTPRIYQSTISSSPFISEKDSNQIENEYNKQEALYQFQINQNNNNNNSNNNNKNQNNSNNNNNNNNEGSSNSSNSHNKNNSSTVITNSAIRISILGQNEMVKLNSQFENYLVSTVSNEITGWSSLEWMSNDFINKFIKIISCIPINNSLVITSFSKALNLFCKTFGTVFTKRVVKNAFNREFQKDPRTDNTKKYRLLSIYTTGALQTLESSELTSFLKDLIVQISMEERGWSKNDKQSLVKCIELLCGNVFDKKKDVAELLSDLTANPSNQVRSNILEILNAIIPSFKTDQIANSVVPSLITLSTDPDRQVRFDCLGTLSIAVSYLLDDSVIERVAFSIDRILDDKNHLVEVKFVNSMTKIIPTVKPRFRDSFIVPRIIELARKNNLDPSGQQRKSMSQSLFDAIRAYVSVTNVPKELIQEQILPMLKLLLNDDLISLHDQTFKSMIQSLINDLEQSFKEDFKNSISKRNIGGFLTGNNNNSNNLLNKIEAPNLGLPKWSWKKDGGK